MKKPTEAIRQSTATTQQTFYIEEEARAATGEAATVGKMATQITTEMKVKGLLRAAHARTTLARAGRPNFRPSAAGSLQCTQRG